MRAHLGLPLEASTPSASIDVTFRMIPMFEEKVLEHRDGHYVVQDWKGNVCEISDQFDVTYLRQAKDFVTRRWIRCPVANRDDWEQMKQRYTLDSPGRFDADFAAAALRARSAGKLLYTSFPGPFWQMREWCGFEGLCFMMVEQPDLVAEMAGFWTAHVSGMLARMLSDVVPDVVHISEDMAYKEKAMISPAMTREFCMPSWRMWSRQARSAGVSILDMDSDGFIGGLIPLWIESGINVCDPVEVAAGNDIAQFHRQYGTAMGYVGGADKRAMARGGEVLHQEMRRLEPVVHSGGYIPGCDHGIPSDVPWANMLDYCSQLARITGWL